MVPDDTDSFGDADNTVARLASLPGLDTASGMATGAAGASAVGKLLPVVPELTDVLPHRGLRRGSTVSVIGSRLLVLSLLAEATARGSWAAVVGMPDLGVVAAAELGVEVSRLALVPAPGAELVPAVAALLDGLDLVVVGRGVNGRTARQLSARARHRGAVLVSAGAWPGVDVELRCEEGPWSGLGTSGYGYLSEREVMVHSSGRGSAVRPMTARLLVPGAGGRLARLGTTEAEPMLEAG
ncbi:MAG: hypothetical protein GEV04_00690 [Actinophytocola sp.]|nr:hypothetical protein [Actinophytocola sp.]